MLIDSDSRLAVEFNCVISQSSQLAICPGGCAVIAVDRFISNRSLSLGHGQEIHETRRLGDALARLARQWAGNHVRPIP